MATRMQQRRGTATQWTDANPILAAGEIGFETDTNQFKIGDGTNVWADLSYFQTLDGLGGTFDDYVALADVGVADGVASLDENGRVPLSQLANVIDAAPETLDTLSEIANALTDAQGLVNTAITNAINGEVTARDAAIDAAGVALTSDITDAYTQAISDAEGSILAAAGQDATNKADQAEADAIAAAALDATDKATAAQAAAEATAAAALDSHESDTLNVHGITDTAELATKTGTETLTNKTIDTADNTITVVLADVSDVTATAAEVNVLSGVTSSTAELNYLDGVTANVQNQLDSKASTDSPTFTGTVNAAAVTITGDLTVGGTTTTVNAQDLVVTDPLIYVGEGNSTNVVDLGVVSSFNDGTYQHSGIVRDATDNKWKLFRGVTDEPTTTVNFAQATYETLKLGGVEFSDGEQTKQGVPSITPISQKTASYTGVLTDRDTLIEIGSSSATTFTIPTNASVAYPVGTSFDILQTGTGQVTIAGASGVTVNATPGLKLRTQWSSATVFKRAENTWVVYGDLSA
jgi:hypothetical protein